jgi:hypothetical protein
MKYSWENLGRELGRCWERKNSGKILLKRRQRHFTNLKNLKNLANYVKEPKVALKYFFIFFVFSPRPSLLISRGGKYFISLCKNGLLLGVGI